MRSSWKLPFTSKIFNKKNIFYPLNEFYLNKVNLRHFIIPSTLINEDIYIYNGHLDFLTRVTSKMVGHKFGEFAVTKTLGRAFRKACEKKKKKKKENNGASYKSIVNAFR